MYGIRAVFKKNNIGGLDLEYVSDVDLFMDNDVFPYLISILHRFPLFFILRVRTPFVPHYRKQWLN